MKRALLILFIGLASKPCGEKHCFKSQFSIEEFKSELKITQQTKHAAVNKNCNLIIEWLNRKNIGHFLKNHISLEPFHAFSLDKSR
jgi:hypothetical protein